MAVSKSSQIVSSSIESNKVPSDLESETQIEHDKVYKRTHLQRHMQIYCN